MINKEEVKNILITRTDRLGDVILTLPLITETKKIFKSSNVLFLVRKYLEELIKDYDGIDELVIEENLPGFFNKYKFFKSKNIDLVINVKPRFDFALLFFLLRVKYRIGIAYRWYSFLYNYKVYEHRKVSNMHESDYNLNLLKFFFNEVKSEKKFYFKYSENEKNYSSEKFSSYNLRLEEKYIIIHPGSGGSAKDLPIEKFFEYINIFLSEFNDYTVVLTGKDNEKALIKKIKTNVKKEFEKRVIDLSAVLNLRELLILIDNSQLFISNSTGPIHIAGALNKNIIGFYAREKPMCDTRWKPLSEKVVILTPDKVSDDMNKIEVDEIIEVTRNFLGN